MDWEPLFKELRSTLWWLNAAVTLTLGVLSAALFELLKRRWRSLPGVTTLLRGIRAGTARIALGLGRRGAGAARETLRLVGPYLRLGVQTLLVLAIFSIVSGSGRDPSATLPSPSRRKLPRQQRDSISKYLARLASGDTLNVQTQQALKDIGEAAFGPVMALADSRDADALTRYFAFNTGITILRDAGNPGTVEYLMRRTLTKSYSDGFGLVDGLPSPSDQAADALWTLGYDAAPRTFRDSLWASAREVRHVAALSVSAAALRGEAVQSAVLKRAAEVLWADARAGLDDRRDALVTLRILLRERLLNDSLIPLVRYAVWGDLPRHGIVVSRTGDARAGRLGYGGREQRAMLLREATDAGSHGLPILIGWASPDPLGHGRSLAGQLVGALATGLPHRETERWEEAMNVAEVIARFDRKAAREPLLDLWWSATTDREEQRAFHWVGALWPAIPCDENTRIAAALVAADARNGAVEERRAQPARRIELTSTEPPQSTRLKREYRLITSGDTCYYERIR